MPSVALLIGGQCDFYYLRFRTFWSCGYVLPEIASRFGNGFRNKKDRCYDDENAALLWFRAAFFIRPKLCVCILGLEEIRVGFAGTHRI